ncbi:MAG: hypothetical protein RMJ98_04375 [Myxococcales bacterium]|nr:hypothetical protein [Myxococcales bacterium]
MQRRLFLWFGATILLTLVGGSYDWWYGRGFSCDVDDPYAAKKIQHLGLALLVGGLTLWAI